MRTLLRIAYLVILGSGWVFYLSFPRLPTGTKVEMTPENRVVAEHGPVGKPVPKPHVVSTGNGQTKTFALPGKSRIALLPNSQLKYQGDWTPQMTGTLHGEGILDVPEGTTWTIYSLNGRVEVGPGRYALYTDKDGRGLNIAIDRGRVISGGPMMFIKSSANGLEVVEDGTGFPKLWGDEAVVRHESGSPPSSPTIVDRVRKFP